MFFIKIRNGLGNQMFVYAFGEYLRERFPAHVIAYDYSDMPFYIEGRKTYSVKDIFEYSFEEATPKEIRKYCGHPLYFRRVECYDRKLKNRIIRKLNLYYRHPRNKVIVEPPYWRIPESFHSYMDNLKLDNEEVVYFDGYWEETRYIINPKHIRDCFAFKDSCLGDSEIGNSMKKSESVAVHIRRGDYVRESLQQELPKNYFDVCRKDYYDSAARIIEQKIKDPHYFIFSDDIEYAKSILGNKRRITLVEGNKDYQDMQLMTFCKHHIIANSTFSFWGAYLGNRDGINIAPKIHLIRMEESGNTIKHFFEVEDWIYIDNKPENMDFMED